MSESLHFVTNIGSVKSLLLLEYSILSEIMEDLKAMKLVAKIL